MPTIDYLSIGAIFTAIYILLKFFWADFPLTQDLFVQVWVAILTLIGYNITDKPRTALKGFLQKKFSK
jgi:hypothetical protein